MRTWPSSSKSRRADAFFHASLRVAREYGRLKNDLWAKGRPLPENDIWIAAVASHHNLILATRDRHFREVEGLAIAMW